MANKEPEETPPVVWIPVNKLFVDSDVNTRPLQQARVDRLAENFDPDLVGVLDVAPREHGRYAIIDGQHRAQAVRQALGEDQNVPCWVHKRITKAKQASLFVGLNNSSAVPPLYQFIGRVNAGEAKAVAIHDIVTAAGLKLETSARDNTIRCVSALERIYTGGGDYTAGPKALESALSIIINAWGATTSSLNGSIVEGVGLVLLRYRDQIDTEALIQKLATTKGGPAALLGQARALKDWRGGTVPRCVAGAVVTIYNKGRRTGALGDWWS